MRSLGQPVGSLAADLIGVSMITCKNDRLLELLWFVGYCIEFPTQLAVRIGGGAEWNRRVMYRAIREGYVRLYRKKHKRHVIRSMSLTQKGFEYVVPPEIDKIPAARAKFIQAMEDDQRIYEELTAVLMEGYLKELLEQGVPEKAARSKAEKHAIEDARYVLPNACATRIVMTANARSLKNFFRLRCCNRAQWEIRALAEEMYKQVYAVAPTLFGHCGPACVDGVCTEGKMSCGKAAEVRAHYQTLREGK